MKIIHCKLNHLTNPLGWDVEHPTISYVVTEARGCFQRAARVWVSLSPDFAENLYDSGERSDIVSTSFELPIDLKPMTRYYWKVWVRDDAGDAAESAVQWFETGKDAPWRAQWITPDADKSVQAVLFKHINVQKPVATARAYVVGLGLYELSLNGEKQGDECLLPGFCDYDDWIQYQTFDLPLSHGDNLLELTLGDGWYKGNFGLVKRSENYGDRLAAIAEVHIRYQDGTEEIVCTDESWQARRSPIVASGIYCGEVFDAMLDTSGVFGVRPIDLGHDRLCARLSPPIRAHERLKPVEVLHTPAGETVLDMGQNMVGWLEFHSEAPKGTEIRLQFGELLQEGCFYRDNLRSAKAEFTYISDGTPRDVRQHFTFYGFRFVKIEGWVGPVDPNAFTGLVIHSDMDERGDIKTSDALVNQLVHNARWGMKGNFLDVPTDCPQRDERYGWTGDAQIFSGTACYFMDTYAFYTKFGHDLYMEQRKLDGSVPDVVPVANYSGDASTVWADAATVIPWNTYLHSGDRGILRRQYPSMKAWVDYMKRQDDADGGKRLWLTGAHYGDWLALDGNWPGGVYGGTDPNYIASAYYYYSTRIVARAAHILGYAEDAACYDRLAGEIRAAFERAYFTPSGRLAIDTMTACVLALHLDLAPDYAVEQVRRMLLNRLQKNFYHLDTGFTGTPCLCRVLSENGMNDIAYHLLLEKGYPGWLYEVLMGATTIWERWNSVMPDGRVSGTEMNSMNHYSYGSIVEWMFRDMAGINPVEDAPGFKRFILSPKPNYQIGSASAKLDSAAGLIESEWTIEDGRLSFAFTVPFDTQATIVLPDAEAGVIEGLCRGQNVIPDSLRQLGADVSFTAGPGRYRFTYAPTAPYRKVYSLDSSWEELSANPKTLEIIKREYAFKEDHIPFEKELCTLREMSWSPFTSMTEAQRQRIDRLLRAVEP